MNRYGFCATVLSALLVAAGVAGCQRLDSPSPSVDRSASVTVRGEPVALEGRPPAVGEQAPDFTAVAIDMSEKQLSDWRGKTVLLTSVPSLDTPVCDTEMRTFNEHAAGLGERVEVVTVSMDLPFAQKRWCGAHDIERVTTLSDYRDRSFAQQYGLRIRETGLLARSVFVIGPDGIIRYRQIVPEVTSEPDYEAAIDAARDASR